MYELGKLTRYEVSEIMTSSHKKEIITETVQHKLGKRTSKAYIEQFPYHCGTEQRKIGKRTSYVYIEQFPYHCGGAIVTHLSGFTTESLKQFNKDFGRSSNVIYAIVSEKAAYFKLFHKSQKWKCIFKNINPVYNSKIRTYVLNHTPYV